MTTHKPHEAPANASGYLANIKTALILGAPILVLVGGLELAAYAFSGKSTDLEREGIVTTAEVYKVTEDALGVLLSDAGRKSSARSKLSNYTKHYRFVTEEGETIEDSHSGQAYSRPDAGETMEIRYLPSNPSVHETAIGHTESQTSALHWIAAFFFAVWLAMIAYAVVSPFLPAKKLTTREKRMRRMKELQQD